MSNAYLAPSLVVLRTEINTADPDRDRTSDGWIGDEAHQERKSDHNPDPKTKPPGVVRATDTDKDGIDAPLLVRIAIKDHRVEYVIFNGFIWSREYGFKKRVYKGANKHEHHVHISIRHGRLYENDTSPWGFYEASKPTPSGEFIVDDTAKKEIRAIFQQELRTALGNPNSDKDADPTHDSLADIRRDLRDLKDFLDIK